MKAYTVKQVAEQLGVSKNKVFELIRTGQLKSLKIGRARRVTDKQLNEFITELEASADGDS